MPPRRRRDKADEEEERASLLGLGLAVKQLREEAGMTRDAVCKRGGLTGNTITHTEEGLKEAPCWGTFRRLARGLDVELDDLVLLGIELAPGEAGERLRQRERETSGIDVEDIARGAMEAEERKRRREEAEGRALWLEEIEGREP